tara:strand:- start:635 stop:739 length:105 start_codon:yes stop_codon:yes gene_type:complete
MYYVISFSREEAMGEWEEIVSPQVAKDMSMLSDK